VGGASPSGSGAAASGSGDIYGVVSSVSLLASSSSSSVASFPVQITVTGTPSGLYAGASATVSIITEQLNNVVEAPTAAISYTTGSPTVTEVVGGKDVTEPVTTGIAASGETQITAGLKAGDVITERVVSFNANAARGAARTLLGGSGTGTGANTRTGGVFGGTGGFPGGAGGGAKQSNG
jgi:hypothetical protein